ncbi:MAG: TrkH family potassium uptake protein [Thermoleophilia bacterium]|nr:TrkH family potassium uptake protein [Thermoleophilia bacterium]
MSRRFLSYLVAVVIVAVGTGVFASAIVSAIYGDPDLEEMLVSGAICLGVGLPLLVLSREGRRACIGFREGFLGVLASWIVAAVFGAIPYVITGIFGPLDALFESVSGFTTTGASVLTDYDQAHGIMFWRSLSQWYGGLGVVLLFIALLPAVGGGAVRLFAAEAPGPTPERLTPRLRDTAKRLWCIYVGLSLAEFLLLLAVGLGPFSALTHTFTTMATGGFSPEAASVGAFGSWPVELVIVVFMVLAGGNFALYFALVSRGGRRRAILRDAEFLSYLGALVVSTILVGASLTIADSGIGAGKAFRDAMFQTVSIQTTTGFATTDFSQWNSFAHTILVLLMFVGGCAGSTAGGIKVVRLLLLGKSVNGWLKREMHPRAVIPVKLGSRVVPEHVLSGVFTFFFLWVATFVVGTLLLATTNVNLVTSASAVAATLNVVGPGLDLVGPMASYAFIDPFGKVVLMVMMLLGRLELLAVVLPFTRAFWKR